MPSSKNKKNENENLTINQITTEDAAEITSDVSVPEQDSNSEQTITDSDPILVDKESDVATEEITLEDSSAEDLIIVKADDSEESEVENSLLPEDTTDEAEPETSSDKIEDDVTVNEISSEAESEQSDEVSDVDESEQADDVSDADESEQADISEVVETVDDCSDVVCEEAIEEAEVEDNEIVSQEESSEEQAIAEDMLSNDNITEKESLEQSEASVTAPINEVWRDRLMPVGILCAICMVAALLLSLTNQLTAPIIEANTLSAEQSNMRLLIPQADDFVNIELTGDSATMINAAYKATTGEDTAGYIVTVASKGYGGDVPIIVAFDAEGTLTAIAIGDNSETPGIGDRIYEEDFIEQFIGLTTVLADTDYDGISGATYSSGAVYESVNKALTVIIDITAEEE